MKEKESENLEKEDPKIICSACQIFANIFKKHFSKHSACIQTSRILVFIIDYQTTFQE